MYKNAEKSRKNIFGAPALIFGILLLVLFFGAMGVRYGSKGAFMESSAAAVDRYIDMLRKCEEEQYDPVLFETSSRYSCYRSALVNITKANGVAAAVTSMEKYLKEPEGKLLEGGRCHALGHEIGITAVLDNTSDEEILVSCGDFCGFGCLNGAAHARVLISQSVEEMEAFCNKGNIEESIRLGCYHGIGHGVMEYSGFDLGRSLAMCDKLSSEAAKFECGHAVLMEPQLISGEALEGAAPKFPNNIVEFCESTHDPYRESCFKFAGFLTYAKSRDINKSFASCQNVPDYLRDRCFERAGEALFYARDIIESPQLASAACGELAEEQDIRRCLFGVNRISIGGMSSTGEFSLKVCANAPMSARGECYKGAASVLSTLHGKARKSEFCEKVPQDYRGDCFGE